MSATKSECRKFSPNVFNKSKCQNCFRTKDTHSAEALENNRASRNVSKCGYLFVAPDWDFNVSINRTKRWQRRWFVLYDDGELTYSLDEFPDTIPQGTIDMNKVLDVSDAESSTGNEFSISITTPDKVHFIKGTSKEESKWWFNVLSRVLSRHSSRGKHKRNATFPCGKATIPTTAEIAQDYCSEDEMLRVNNSSYGRPKFLSTSEICRNEKQWISAVDAEEDEDVFYSELNESENKRDVEVQNALNRLISEADDARLGNESTINREEAEIQKDCLSQLEELDARRRNRRYLKRENRIQRSQRSRNDGVSKMIPAKNRLDKTTGNDCAPAIVAAEKLEYLESIHVCQATEKQPNVVADEEEMSYETSTPLIRRNHLSTKTNLRKSESLKHIPSETQSEMRDHVSGLRRYHSFKVPSSHRKIKPNHGTSSLKRMKPSRSTVGGTATSPVHSLSSDQKASSESSILSPPEICYEHAHEGVFTRTGWLMRQTLSKDWSRHWFVMRDSTLTYYRDPSAENSGIMDGILDLNQVSTIRDTDSDRYYAFSLRMWDSKKHVLAAESEDFRSMWIQALQYASNLWSSASKEDFICSEIVLPEHTYHTDRSVDRISSPSSLSSLPYIGDNLTMEASYASSDDQSEYFSLVDEDEISDLSSSPRTLPPSPPINRNMISLVKEKSRTRSSSGMKTSTPATGTESSIGHSLDESHNSTFSHYKDAIDSMLLEKEKNSLDSSSETKDGDRRISSTKSLAESPDCPEDSENIQFSLEFEDQVCKDEQLTERDYDGHVESAFNSLPSESSGISISDSKNTDECQRCLFVKSKLVAAKEEIRRLKKELKEAHANFDNLEMYSFKLKQDIKVKEDSYTSEIALMTAKIDDLTSKFTLAEKNYRQLKQKNLKSENKERKRSSLKSREALSLTKEYELKLCDLEKKIDCIETNLQRETPDEDSKILQSQTKTEGCSPLSESDDVCDTSASTDLSSTNSVLGFFSRLQSLGSKVDTVSSRISESSASSPEFENPKIRLDAAMDGFSRVDDSDDSLPRSSSNDSNECLDLYLNGTSRYQSIILRKINKILRWLNTSLNVACRDGNESSNIEGGKLLMLQSLVGALSPLCLSNSSNMLEDSEQIKTSHAVMLAYKVVWFLERIDDIDSFDCLIKLNIAQLAFKALIRTLCITFAEYENSEMSNVLRFISEVPQLRFFCPIVDNLFPKSQEEIEQFSLVSERLQQLNDEQNNILNTIQTAKKLRYECLWNTLTDIPVQDAGVNRTQNGNSILNYVTSIATYIYRIAEVQLFNVPCLSSYMFKIEQEKVRDWSSAANVSLKDDLAAFLSELKEQCPMLHESSVLVSELCETKRKEITCYVTELSFFSVSFSVLSSLLTCLSTVNETCQFSSEDLVHHFDGGLERFEGKQFFNCPQCATLNSFLSSSEQTVSWPACVEKYKFYNSRKCDCFSYNLDNLSCINCSDSKDSVVNSNKDVCNNLTCAECDNWINKFLASEKQHELERQALELKYNKDLEQLEDCLIKSSEVHEQEMLQKESELESTTAQLQSLKVEYEDQIKTLKNLYEQKLHFDCENIDEESLRQVYKAEVEDLKDMFKKGLAAIENSHYRITSELEKRHKDEVKALANEKEKALEIEAQATVTALEAIKKCHEQQLKEETAHIKAELMRKFQLGQEYETFYSKYGGDLEKLKDEIVHITEMYSEKCMENIALEEKVSSLRYQLEEAHSELCGLLKKNKEMDMSYVNVC